MKTSAWTLILLASLTAVTAHAQSVKDEAKTLSDALVKQQRYLRGFSAEANVHWRWKDGALVTDEPAIHMLSAVIANSVKASGNKIDISADRYAVYRDNNGKPGLSPLHENVKVTVDLTGSDIASVLPRLEEILFYRNLDEALSALPSVYQDSLPPYADSSHKPKDASPPGCDCTDAIAKKCGKPNDLSKEAGWTAPKLLYAAEPEFSEEARRSKFNGDVQTGFRIDTSGHVSDIWIVRPAGLGLTQKAVEAVRQYRFAPATCHGKPAETYIFVKTNFQIF